MLSEFSVLTTLACQIVKFSFSLTFSKVKITEYTTLMYKNEEKKVLTENKAKTYCAFLIRS